MIKKLSMLIVSFSLVCGNTFGQTIIKPLPTKYDKKQDEKIDINEKTISNNKKEIVDVDDKHTTWNTSQNLDIKTNQNSINGLDNRISELEETQYIIGIKGRIYDSKKLQVNLFADYSTNRNKVDRTGIRFTYKFGQSYEEKLIAKQNERLEQLERKLGIKKEPEIVGKTKDGLNIIAEPNGNIRIGKRF